MINNLTLIMLHVYYIIIRLTIFHVIVLFHLLNMAIYKTLKLGMMLTLPNFCITSYEVNI